MKQAGPRKPVERLFPFVLRSRILIVGRDNLARSKRKLHFVLIASDVSASICDQVLRDFSDYPIVQHYTGDDLERFFGTQGAKVIGFQKSDLAKSLYAELKGHRIAPLRPPSPPASPPPQAAIQPLPQTDGNTLRDRS